MKKLWKMLDWGRDAFVGGLFVATDEEVNQLIGKHIYLGDVEGKYSDVSGTFEDGDIELITDDVDFISKFTQLIGCSYGINPLGYLEESEE